MSADQVERKLAAIFAADVEGYSRLMGIDEVGTLRTLTAYRVVMDGLIARHRGRIVNTAGDSVLAEFASVVDAVQCAVDVQQALGSENESKGSDRQMHFRIGVHVGDVLLQDGNLFGDGVNIAARLEALAEPGGVCVSGAVRDYVGKKLPVVFADCGEQAVKNIAEPVRAYRIGAGATVPIGAKGRPALDLPDKPSIAVLPFANMSGDPEQDYFADGIVEDITTALSRVKWFFVIARNSSLTYTGRAVDVKQVARELGVRYVLEGSVRKANNRLRITAQLIDAGTGNHIWAERYDREIADIFAVQDEITESVVAAIEPQLYVAESLRIQTKPPESLDAWGCVIRALWHIGRLNKEDNEHARELLKRAIVLSPRYAKAHSLRAFAELRSFATAASDFESALAVADHHARTALTLDDQDAWVYFALGAVRFWRGKYEEAIAAYRGAIELNPNFAIAHGFLGESLAWDCKPDAALEAVDRAMRMSPRDPFNAIHLLTAGTAHFVARRYTEGVACERKALQERPRLVAALRMLAACYAGLDKLDVARASISEVLSLEPGCSMKKLSERPGFTCSSDQERFTGALRKAGMPE